MKERDSGREWRETLKEIDSEMAEDPCVYGVGVREAITPRPRVGKRIGAICFLLPMFHHDR